MIDREKAIKLFWDDKVHHTYLLEMGLHETAEIVEVTLIERMNTFSRLSY